jgi:hypothetical protein
MAVSGLCVSRSFDSPTLSSVHRESIRRIELNTMVSSAIIIVALSAVEPTEAETRVLPLPHDRSGESGHGRRIIIQYSRAICFPGRVGRERHGRCK